MLANSNTSRWPWIAISFHLGETPFKQRWQYFAIQGTEDIQQRIRGIDGRSNNDGCSWTVAWASELLLSMKGREYSEEKVWKPIRMTISCGLFGRQRFGLKLWPTCQVSLDRTWHRSRMPAQGHNRDSRSFAIHYIEPSEIGSLGEVASHIR